MFQDVKYFDSADWALQKEGKTPKDAQTPVPSEAEQVPLQPKLSVGYLLDLTSLREAALLTFPRYPECHWYNHTVQLSN